MFVRMQIAAMFAAVLFLSWAGAARAEEPSAQEMRSLDEQVQEIKTDVLAIAAELSTLEEQLLYNASCLRLF